MAFPDDDLDLTVEAAFGADVTADPGTWVWTDLTDRLTNEPITIRQGTANGASKPEASSAVVHLTNADGHLTPHNAESPLWPMVDRGVPVRVRLNTARFTATDTFTRTVAAGSWGTSDSGHGWGTPVSSADHSVSGGKGRQSIATVNILRIVPLTGFTENDYDAAFDVTVPVVATGGTIITGATVRYASSSNHYGIRVEFNTNSTVVVKMVKRVASKETELGSETVPGLTYTAGATMRVRVQVQGPTIRVRVWPVAGAEPGPWHLHATDHTFTTGGFGFRSYLASGNSNPLPVVLTFDNLSITDPPADRIAGYGDDWQPTFLPSGGGQTWSTVALSVNGVSRRLERGATPALSPLRRSIQLAEVPPLAYWPLEDAADSRRAASALPGVGPMIVAGVITFASTASTPEETFTSRTGTRPLASLAAGGRLSGTAPAPAVFTGQWAVHFLAQSRASEASSPSGFDLHHLMWSTPGGTYSWWRLSQTTPGGLELAGTDAATGAVVSLYTSSFSTTALTNYQVDAIQNGANADIRIWISGGLLGSFTLLGVTLAPVTTVKANPSGHNVTGGISTIGRTLLMGHIRVYDYRDAVDVPRYTDTRPVTVRASSAWANEQAHRRIRRLCEEERVPIEGPTAVESPTLLNAQADGGFNELIASAAEAESGGLLYETNFGYAYLSRSDRYNRPVDLTVDLTTYRYAGGDDPADVLVPILDDQGTRTVWSLERTGGSTAEAEANPAFIARKGRLSDSATIEVLTDADLTQHANWRVHRDTPDEPRYPTLPLDLAANPELLDEWLRCRIGSRVVRTGQPDIAGHGPIDQVLVGYSETLGPRTWTVSANCVPYSPWRVFRLDDPVLGKLDTDGSRLAAGVNATATSLSVTITAGPRWTTDGAELPFDVGVGGEQITVTAISGASSPQTFTVVRSVNGVSKSHAAGAAVSLWQPPALGL